MESSVCSTQSSLASQPSLVEDVFPKTPPATGELSEEKKEPASSLRPKTPSSPDPNCAICLGKLQNTSFTDSCLHQFCFTCLLEWSKVKPECPLCKQTFKSIIHNVRSIEDYDQYHLHPAETNHRMWSALDVELRRRHSMLAVGMWHTPTLLHERTFRGFLPGDDAVIPSMSRVPLFRLREVVTAEFRRSIYERNMWAEPLSDVTGRFRECTAEFFRQNEASVHRLLPWVNRELDAVLWNGVNKTHVMELILNMLRRYNIRSSEFRVQLTPYIRGYTTHFLHEFYNFARSPYDMIGFDRSVTYGRAGQTALEILTSSDESDGDVMVLSSPGRSAAVSPELLSVRVNRTPAVVAGSSRQANATFEQAMEQLARRMVEHEAALNSDSTVDLEVNDADSDCMIVGYVKPRHERTPEIITLASDEELGVNQPTVEEIPRLLSHSFNSTTGSESSSVSQASDSDYCPPKSRSKCRKKKITRKCQKESKTAEKEKPSKSYRHAVHKSRKSTSSVSKTKKLKKLKELFSSSSSSQSSSSSDEELHVKKRTRGDDKASHYKGTWHVKLRGATHDEEAETHRDHNYMISHNPPYSKEEIDNLQQQSVRNPPKLKSIVITRTFPDTSPSVSGSSSYHQSHTSSSKHSHSHRSSRKRSKHDKNRSGKSERRHLRFSSSDTSACRLKLRKLYSSESDDSS
ncbi:E3 ubiquitin-protein ligase Topors-like [Bacillus rossius redtenbacheri]|uniref:E3 ubiquitin-protein ligase Topors-like n=1 Tax=Bacillus rossius redtenbacheri TaxID=93214 RepID=UPI002FDCD598